MNLKLHFGAVFWVSWGSLGRPKNIKLGIFVAFLVAASTHCFGHLPDYAKKQKRTESVRKAYGILGPFRRPKDRCQHALLRTRTLANSLVFVVIRAQKSCSRVEQINKKRDMDTERNSPRSNESQMNLKLHFGAVFWVSWGSFCPWHYTFLIKPCAHGIIIATHCSALSRAKHARDYVDMFFFGSDYELCLLLEAWL